MPDTAAKTAAAQAYEDHLVRALFGPWAERVVALAAPAPGETVLDLACGSGIGARLAGPRVAPDGRVIGVDSDAGMVAVAERTTAAAGMPAGVAFEWHACGAEALPLADASVDLCLYLQGPQFVTDPPQALAEVRRVLKAGGRMAASTWSVIEDNKGHHALARALEARGLKPALKPFSLGLPETARAIVEAAGFAIERFETGDFVARYPSVRAFIDGVAAGAPATRHALAQLSEAERAGFVADIEATLAPYAADPADPAAGIRLPTRAHLVLARPRA